MTQAWEGALVLHFEHRTPELKLDQLYEEWESELY